MNDPRTPAEVADSLKDTATALGLHIWPGTPEFSDGAVQWGDDEDPASFVRHGADLGAKVLYVSTREADGEVAHVRAVLAHHGILFQFDYATPDLRSLIGDVVVGGSDEDEAETELTDDEVEAIALSLGRFDQGPAGETWPDALKRIMGSAKRAARLEPIVDAIVADPGYGRFRNRPPIVAEHVKGLNDRDRHLVRQAVDHRWEVFLEPGLKAEADRLADEILERDDVDLFMHRWDDFVGLVHRTIPDIDPQLAPFVAGAVRSGLRELLQEAKKRSVQEGPALYDALDPATRDALGFSKRPEIQAGLLEDALVDVPKPMRRLFVMELVEMEQERNMMSRERRYATVGRALLDRGKTKAAAARALGLSPTILDRLISSHRVDVAIPHTDYLAPLLSED